MTAGWTSRFAKPLVSQRLQENSLSLVTLIHKVMAADLGRYFRVDNDGLLVSAFEISSVKRGQGLYTFRIANCSDTGR